MKRNLLVQGHLSLQGRLGARDTFLLDIDNIPSSSTRVQTFVEHHINMLRGKLLQN